MQFKKKIYESQVKYLRKSSTKKKKKKVLMSFFIAVLLHFQGLT